MTHAQDPPPRRSGQRGAPRPLGLPAERARESSTPTIRRREALKNAAPVALPPAITDSRTYRCSDNSLVYVDFYNNNTAAGPPHPRRRADPADPAGGAGPYAGEGHTVSGNGTHVTINGKSCHT